MITLLSRTVGLHSVDRKLMMKKIQPVLPKAHFAFCWQQLLIFGNICCHTVKLNFWTIVCLNKIAHVVICCCGIDSDDD